MHTTDKTLAKEVLTEIKDSIEYMSKQEILLPPIIDHSTQEIRLLFEFLRTIQTEQNTNEVWDHFKNLLK